MANADKDSKDCPINRGNWNPCKVFLYNLFMPHDISQKLLKHINACNYKYILCVWNFKSIYWAVIPQSSIKVELYGFWVQITPLHPSIVL